MKWIVLAVCLVAVVSARPNGKGGDRPDEKGLLKKLCGMLKDKVDSAAPTDRGVDEAVEMLKTLCSEFADKDDGANDKRGNPSSDMDGSGEKLSKQFGSVCEKMAKFYEKYFAEGKRGEEEWTNIFVELGAICEAAFGDDADKRSEGDEEMKKDGMKIVFGVIKFCGNVRNYVEAYGTDTGNDDANVILGAVIKVCMDVKTELDQYKADDASADKRGAPKAESEKAGDGNKLKAALGRVCGGMVKFYEKYFADDKRGEEEWKNIFVELGAICEAAFGDDEADKRSEGDEEMKKDGMKIVFGVIKFCGNVRDYVEAYGTDTGNDDANVILGAVIKVCMDVKTELDQYKSDGGSDKRKAPKVESEKAGDGNKLKAALGRVCGGMANFYEKYFADDKRGEEEWKNIFVELGAICEAAFGDDEADKRSEVDEEMKKDGMKLVFGVVKFCGNVRNYVEAYGTDTGNDDANVILGAVIKVCMDVKTELDQYKAEKGSSDRRQGPNPDSDKEENGEKLKNKLEGVCRNMGRFYEKYFAEGKRGEEEWTNIFVELGAICEAAFGDDEDKRSEGDKEMKEDAINLVMNVVKFCGNVGNYVEAYGTDTGNDDANVILGATIKVCMDVKTELEQYEADKNKSRRTWH